MDLATIEGDFKYDTKDEIAAHMRRSSALPLDDIWISGESKYPCLAILINGCLACVHYFEEDGAMWQSYGDFPNDVRFLAGGEEWEAPADTVVSLEKAISCMEEFFDTGKRPECIEWQEL